MHQVPGIVVDMATNSTRFMHWAVGYIRSQLTTDFSDSNPSN